MRGNIELASYLLKSVDNSATSITCCDGKTLLHFAAQSRRTDMIDFVMRFYDSLAVEDYEGRTPVHQAALYDNVAVLQKIVGLGSVELLHRADAVGKTPLDLAIEMASHSVLKFFHSTMNISVAVEPTEQRRLTNSGVKSEIYGPPRKSGSIYALSSGTLILLSLLLICALPRLLVISSGLFIASTEKTSDNSMLQSQGQS
ncbi:MAG: hypothetical protein Q9160_007993 [Pyrenula sp. 1 TL-2023]